MSGLAQQACDFGAQIVRGRGARAKRAAEVLPDPARVLTHCNVSGELVGGGAALQGTGQGIRRYRH